MEKISDMPPLGRGADYLPVAGTLSARFNYLVSEARRDFPALRGHLAMIDLHEGRFHYDVDLDAAGFKDMATLRKYLATVAHEYGEEGMCYAHRAPEYKLSVILYNNRGNMGMFGRTADSIVSATAIFDHELGHLLGKGAMQVETLRDALYAETVADVYAALRFVQRGYGGLEDIEKLAHERADALLTAGDVEHFTTFALEALARAMETPETEERIRKMTPQESIAFAEDIAARHATPSYLVENIAQNFRHYKDIRDLSPSPEPALRYVADEMLRQSRAPHIARFADAFLGPYLREEVDHGGSPVTLSGPYWDRVRMTLYDRTQEHAKTGLIPDVTPAAAPRLQSKVKAPSPA